MPTAYAGVVRCRSELVLVVVARATERDQLAVPGNCRYRVERYRVELRPARVAGVPAHRRHGPRNGQAAAASGGASRSARNDSASSRLRRTPTPTPTPSSSSAKTARASGVQASSPRRHWSANEARSSA